LRVLAVAGGRCVAQFVADAPIDRLACLPGGRVLALTRTNRFLLCAGGSTRQVQAHQGEVHDVAFIPGTNWVVSAGADRRLQIIDWTDGAIVRRIDCGADAVTTLAVTPDGLQAYGGGKGSRIGAWDLKTGERMAEIPDAGPVSALRVSPDGRLLAAIGADRQTRVWDLRTAPPAELSSLPGQTKAAVFLNADQVLVASGEKASLQVLPVLGKWTARAGPQGIGSVEVVPNSPYVAVAGGTPEVTLWRVFGAKEKSFSVPAGQLTHVAVHPEGTQLAGAGDTAPGAAAAGQVHVWNFADGRLLRSIDVPAAIRGLAYSPTGEFLAVASGDKHARLYRADDGRLVQEIPCEADLAALSFLPDGSTFLAGTANGQIWAHAIAAEQMVQAHAGPVRSVAVSAGGQRLLTAGGEPSTIRLWNVQSLRQPLVRFEGGAGRVVYATLSADDRLVAAVFDDPKHTVCVWPASLDGTAPAVQPIARLTHPSPVRTALITGDGKYVVVGGQGEFVHLWDAPTGKEVARFRKQDAIVQSLAANGRDRTIVAGAVDRSVRVWALPGAAGSGASGSGAGPLAVTDSERSVTLADVPPPAPAPPSGRAARTNPLDQRIARLEFEMRQAKNTDERHKVWQELLRARRERQTNTIVQSAATPAAPGAPVIESRLVSLRQQEAALRQQEAALRQQELD
jgi:WD40 repeat protein